MLLSIALAAFLGLQFPEPPTKSPSVSTAARPFDGYALPRFELPLGAMHLDRAARPSTYFDTVGSRGFLCGTEDGGLEAWIWPWQVFFDGRFSFRPARSLEAFDLHRYARRIEVLPDRTRLRYLQAEIAVDATFVALDAEPAILILLDVEADQPGTLAFSFTPRLQPQWPAAVGGVAGSWDAPRGAVLISEPSARVAAAVGSPWATRATEGLQYLLPGGALRFEIPIDPQRCRRERIPIAVVVADGERPPERARADYDRVLLGARALVEENASAWARRVASMTRIRTSDPELDRAFAWNALSLAQSLVRSRELGDGLVAGYGPAGASSQRPGFAWFFTGDVGVNAVAYLAAGLPDELATGLRLAARHQREDGKIPHEVVLSAHLCEWFADYPFAYIHGETTALWIHAVRLYLDSTSDRALLEELWPAVVKGARWILDQDTDGDGLPDNARAGMGASEIGALLFDLRTDIYLAATSAAALRDVAALASVLGDEQTTRDALGAFERAGHRIADGFWDPEAESCAHSIRTDGALSKERTVWPAVPVWLGLVDGTRAQRTMDAIDAPELTTPWGVRILSSRSENYDPKEYNQGTVWPFVTGLAAFADLEIGRADAGFAKIKSVADWTFAEALGRTPEVISGSRPRSLDTSVPHQMFSSMAVVGPMVTGLFGFTPRRLENRVELRPCFPEGWTEATLENVSLGPQRATIVIRREGRTYHAKVDYALRGAATPVTFELRPRNGEAGKMEVHTTP